jgi:uncharacterized protein
MTEGILAVVLAVPAAGLVLILVFAVRLFLRQGQIVFRPRAEFNSRSPADFGIAFRDVFLECADGIKVHGWWVPGRLRKTIVYFHGSDGNLTYELSTLRFLTQLGASVLLIDYPGYGRSDGRCSERLCYQAADAAWAFAHGTQGVPAPDVVLFGQSLGTAVATYLAASRECGGLVFQSGFSSVPDIAAALFPLVPVPLIWLFARTRMNSLRRVADCRCPVLVMHSRGDEHIPIAQARAVFTRAPGPKKFVELHGVHHSGEWRHDSRVLAAWRELVDGETAAWERPLAVAAGGSR